MRSISMIIGGALLALGILDLLISWLDLKAVATWVFGVLFLSGFVFLLVGLIFVFMPNIAKKQI